MALTQNPIPTSGMITAATTSSMSSSVLTNCPLMSSLIAFILAQSIKVMYDATGVRLQAGRQAGVLNQIVCELPAEHSLSESRPLRELLGHTPPQVVAGGLLGIMTATTICLITGFVM